MKILLLLACGLLVACETLPENPEQWMAKQENSCVPLAISMREGLKRQGVWAEVFRYDWTDTRGKRHGHAMTAYMYPPGANRLWTYDSMGSYRVRAYTNNVTYIAGESHYARSGTVNTTNAEWIK